MSVQTIFLLAGQGTQYYQMGKSLYDSDTCFRYWMDTQDEYYQQLAGFSVVAQLYHPSNRKSTPFDDVAVTHPAIFMVEYALGKAVQERQVWLQSLLGVSLGELVAFALSGALTWADALQVVHHEAGIIAQTCPPCKMYVMFERVSFFYSQGELYNRAEIVGVNNAAQVVISAEMNRADEIEAYLDSAGIRWIEVPVRYGFHTSRLDAAQVWLQQVYEQVPVQLAAIPVFSARSCQFVSLSAQNKAELLWKRLREPFYLEKAVRTLTDTYPAHVLQDISPNSLFHTQLKLLQPELGDRVASYLSPFRQ